MKYIHELEDWPDFLWDSAALTSQLASVRYKQGHLLGMFKSHGFKLNQLQEEASLVTLTEEVIKSSAIEGEKLNAGLVRSSIARHLGMDQGGITQVSRHIDGLVEMMIDATQNYGDSLSKERLFAWHGSLFPTGRSGMRTIAVGMWRTPEGDPMQVVSGPLGREKVHFEAPGSERLDAEMDRFLAWFNAPSETDPVLKAAIAHFWFVTIHPFEDGNGRIARAITEMALARSDNSSQRYYSMSSQIENERESYYENLKQSQRMTTDITRWLAWFIQCLDRSFDRAEKTLEKVQQKALVWDHANAASINHRQHLIITRLLGDFEGNLNASKYAKMAKCSTDTALRDIRKLLEHGILTKNLAGGRSTSYQLSDPKTY